MVAGEHPTGQWWCPGARDFLRVCEHDICTRLAHGKEINKGKNNKTNGRVLMEERGTGWMVGFFPYFLFPIFLFQVLDSEFKFVSSFQTKF
jgi:hypothetical protein